MRRLRDVLRLKYEQHLPHRAIARACGVGIGTVSAYIARARQAGLTWPLPAELDDTALEARVFPSPALERGRIAPDLARIHQELRRPGVTLRLLWEEYLATYPDGYRYTQFCTRYRRWVRTLRPSMRQVHRAGEKTFIDFSGKKPTIVESSDRGGPDRRALRRRPRRQQLHLRRSHGDPATARLGRRAYPHGRVLRRGDGAVGPRPAEERHHAAVPL